MYSSHELYDMLHDQAEYQSQYVYSREAIKAIKKENVRLGESMDKTQP